MLKEDKQKVINISKLILKILFSVSISVALISLPKLAQVTELFKTDKKYRNKFNREIYRLKKYGYIKTYKKEGEVVLDITKKGIKLVKKYNFKDIKLRKEHKWDKNWRMVLFDIPENKKSARTSLKRKLEQLGFLRYQKSVFIYPYSCKDEIDFISSYFDVEDFVNYIIVKRISDDKKFKEYFNI